MMKRPQGAQLHIGSDDVLSTEVIQGGKKTSNEANNK
jgi:hypothetical protein